MLTYQYYRDNPKEFDKYAGKDLVPLNCSNCGKEFTKRKRLARNAVEYDKSRKAFCSRECFSKTVNTSVSEACANCNNLVTRALSERKKTKNIFCNQSCAASYNNKHKTYGTRRSKLEVFLEEQLRILYPNLQIIANGKEAIESELDFYFPELRFAIELNGPTHYEPIYGTDKFEKIRAGDRQKLIRCYEAGIELMIIDVSKVSYLNEERKKYFLGLVTSQLDSLMGRLTIT
jgi:hypothetical protein